ncbi:MAG: hypothetical protein NTX00_05400 [Candidatus Parcubacteria bacterium]|nr:hypothetical protein [Candidatus Parcubacteria bacterium]
MFLTVHGAIGIIIGQRVSNPVLAFIFGFISHYLFDIIPHGDTNAPKKWNNLIHLALIALIDISVMILLILGMGLKVNLHQWSVIFGFLGAVLPDFLQGFYFLSGKKWFKRHQKVHNFFHFLIAEKYEWNFYTGLVLQLIFFILLITYII